MATAPSQTRIVNKALALLGSVTRIGQIDEASAAARTAFALWDDARDETLADHPWNFAIRRAELAASTTTPLFGYARQFEMPADCLRWLPQASGDDRYILGEQEGRFILSDEVGPLNIRYIARVEDLASWSIGFITAMAHRLAAEMAEPITGGKSGVARRMLDGYDDALARAKRQDGQATGDRRGRIETVSSWLDGRGLS